jgi:hypothetical protein
MDTDLLSQPESASLAGPSTSLRNMPQSIDYPDLSHRENAAVLYANDYLRTYKSGDLEGAILKGSSTTLSTPPLSFDTAAQHVSGDASPNNCNLDQHHDEVEPNVSCRQSGEISYGLADEDEGAQRSGGDSHMEAVSYSQATQNNELEADKGSSGRHLEGLTLDVSEVDLEEEHLSFVIASLASEADTTDVSI